MTRRRLLVCGIVVGLMIPGLFPKPLDHASIVAAAGAELKFAYWNMQYGTGVPAGGGAQCAFANDAEYGTQRAGNAWGTAHIQAQLTRDVGDHLDVIAFGASEINPAFAMSPAAVAAHLGWAGKVEVADEALFARYGFGATDAKPLTRCGTGSMWALYGRVWTTSARTDWVHVVSTHLMHPDNGSCPSGVQIDDLISWVAEKAADGKPVVLLGDFNIVVEPQDPVLYFPEHIARLTNNGFRDAYRALFPDPASHPGATATWHSTGFNPLPGSDINDWALWKRIDYAFVKHAAVTGVRLFNHDIGDPRTCAASDHAGIVVTIGGTSTAPEPEPPAQVPSEPQFPDQGSWPIPAPWSDIDVGSIGVPGTTRTSGEAITIAASGADIWGTTDAFRFVSQPLTGDGSIVARVGGLSGAHDWTKAGLMLRGNREPEAAHASVFISSGKGLAFQRRTASGGASTHTSGGAGGAPVWLRLERRGALVTASHSADGQTWIPIGSDVIALGDTIHAGLAVTSHDNAALAQATFDNIRITAGTPSTSVWSSSDVGAVARAGAAAFNGTSAAITGSGADIWGGADEFHFGYRTVTGNFDLIARVASVDAVDPWTKAGVMIRGSLRADSEHASMFATPAVTKGVAFQRRPLAGGPSIHTGGVSIAPGVWLRVSRRGSTVTAAWRKSSSDDWVTVGQEWIPDLPVSVLAGLAVSSHKDGVVATASFDSVQIVAAP